MTRPAGPVSRFAAYLLDGLAVAAITGGAMLVVELVVVLSGRRPTGLGRWALAAMAAVLLVYQIGFWALAGRTPGMALLGIRVVNRAGRPPSWPAASVRALVLDAFPIGALWCVVDRRHRGVHDLVAHTRVTRRE
jgi:uncharacterized RDD family membrane protein YckC